MNIKRLVSMLLSAAMAVSFTGVSAANAEDSKYPKITYREKLKGLVSPPDKIIYDRSEFNYDNLDLSGMTIAVNNIKETRSNEYSGFSIVTPCEYKIGKVYCDMYSFESGWYLSDIVYDDETGQYSDVGCPGRPDKYTVRISGGEDVLRFSEPDSPDVIHEIEDAYDLSFNIYIDDPDSNSKFIRIDNKEVTGYAFANIINIKDVGDFSADSDTYMYANYHIDDDIRRGDIVSGVLLVDTDRNYVICGDLEVVKPAPGNGDANCDNSVDMADIVLIMQYLSNPNKYGSDGTDKNHITQKGIRNADQNGDGVSVEDALMIQKKLLGLE